MAEVLCSLKLQVLQSFPRMQANLCGKLQGRKRQSDLRVGGEVTEAGEDALASGRIEAWERVDRTMQEADGANLTVQNMTGGM